MEPEVASDERGRRRRFAMVPVIDETIVAIATARGTAALAVVRMTGPRSISIADTCFSGASLVNAASHTAHVGWVLAEDGSEIDHVVVTIFRAPRSVTGEDIVEVSCHGGELSAASVLRRLLQAGAVPARPGEFTQRAYVNGKMDLAQAESVADLIHASSTLSQRVSLAQLRGRYSSLLNSLRAELVDLAAYVELELDFSEEDVEFADRERLRTLLRKGQDLLRRLLASYRTGAKLRDGVRVVIAGRPNAGKSTLLNALVGFDRAIVSPHPGTTRDEIEAEAELGGVRFRFVDTAGLRDTENEIEAEGVARARRAVDEADGLVYVYDLEPGLQASELRLLQDVRRRRTDLPMIVVGNKADLWAEAARRDVVHLDGMLQVHLSARDGLSDETVLLPLIDALLQAVGSDVSSIDASSVVMNERHRAHLLHARDAVESAIAGLEAGVPGDLLALDLRRALDELGSITGVVTSEDVLDQIFSRFCIGK